MELYLHTVECGDFNDFLAAVKRISLPCPELELPRMLSQLAQLKLSTPSELPVLLSKYEKLHQNITFLGGTVPSSTERGLVFLSKVQQALDARDYRVLTLDLRVSFGVHWNKYERVREALLEQHREFHSGRRSNKPKVESVNFASAGKRKSQ